MDNTAIKASTATMARATTTTTTTPYLQNAYSTSGEKEEEENNTDIDNDEVWNQVDDGTDNIVYDDEECYNEVEQTIQNMEVSSLCFHPKHYHSFQQVSFMLSATLKKCAGCDQRIQTVTSFSLFGMGGGDVSKQVLRCLACGAVAHRTCALSDSTQWTPQGICPVNYESAKRKQQQKQTNNTHTTDSSKLPPKGTTTTKSLTGSSTSDDYDFGESSSTIDAASSPQPPPAAVVVGQDDKPSTTATATQQSTSDPAATALSSPIPTTTTTTTTKSSVASPSPSRKIPPKSAFAVFQSPSHSPLRPPPSLPAAAAVAGTNTPSTAAHWSKVSCNNKSQVTSIALPKSDSRDDYDGTMIEGTLNEKKENECRGINALSSNKNHKQQTNDCDNDKNNDDDNDDEQVHVTPLHYANHPFASVSRAIQENVLIYFQQKQRNDNEPEQSSSSQQQQQLSSPSTATATITENYARVWQVSGKEERSSLTDSSLLPSTNEDNTPNTGTDSTNDSSSSAATASSPLPASATSNFGALAVAGGIAGGMAGLAIAGPAGAWAGYLAGMGALGVVLEGSVSVGVVVASVATGANTAQQIHDQLQEKQQQQRVLTMGESGAQRKVLLVRPNIRVDPVWDQICHDAMKSPNAPANQITGFTFLHKTNSPERYLRESDIVETEEDELPTNDKVLLLVGRLLSDKSSVPGHMYRYLIDAFRDRCQKRRELLQTASIQAMSPRARRDDVHAVIKHVTATLLEVKPGLGSTAALTELTATAVEGLVFGQLYDLVFEEIVAETCERDKVLRDKIEAFYQKKKGHTSSSSASASATTTTTMISHDAMHALRMLPESHSPADKLFDCVKFLERISSHFESLTDRGPCADSLLKMACQHMIVVAAAASAASAQDGTTNFNAEISFLEEFARDEQLLRGREGYSLVTLQASLHFLNMSDDLEADIFDQDDDEDNVPMAPSSSSSLILRDT